MSADVSDCDFDEDIEPLINNLYIDGKVKLHTDSSDFWGKLDEFYPLGVSNFRSEILLGAFADSSLGKSDVRGIVEYVKHNFQKSLISFDETVYVLCDFVWDAVIETSLKVLLNDLLETILDEYSLHLYVVPRDFSWCLVIYDSCSVYMGCAPKINQFKDLEKVLNRYNIREQLSISFSFLSANREEQLSFINNSNSPVKYYDQYGDVNEFLPTEIILLVIRDLLSEVKGLLPKSRKFPNSERKNHLFSEIECMITYMLDMANYSNYHLLLDKDQPIVASGPLDAGWDILRRLTELVLEVFDVSETQITVDYINALIKARGYSKE